MIKSLVYGTTRKPTVPANDPLQPQRCALLLSALAAPERLKIVRSLPEAATLRSELQNFRVKIDPKTAHDSYEHWREGDHDDLVLSVSMGAWFRQWYNRHTDPTLARRLRQTGARLGVSAT